MEVGTVVLLHSPFVGPISWGELPAALAAEGFLRVVVVDIAADDEPPYAASYIAHAAQQIEAAAPAAPLMLVGHSGAGPLLPQIGFAQRAARRQVGAYVFLDAMLPRAGASRIDLLHAWDDELAHRTRHELRHGALAPVWSDDELAASGLNAAQRAAVLASARPRGLAFFEEVIPHPSDWPDAPCGFLRTSAGAADLARLAGLRGFAVAAAEGGHFAAMIDPAGVAAAIRALVTNL